MHQGTLTRHRLGALALGCAALLLTVFPLIRPFFPLDPRAPTATLLAASPAITSAAWVVSHGLCTVAFILLLYGMLTLYAHLAQYQVKPRPFRALVWSVAGIALILPMLGLETYMLPILGRLYLAGASDIAPAVQMLYHGPALVVFLLGLILLAIGASSFALAIWHSAVLPRWAGVCFAIGLALWFPPFPRLLRILDGVAIGLGGVWLAWHLWHTAAPGLTDEALPASVHVEKVGIST